jgi:DNA-binding NarL/FixJ family response regulator
MTAMRERSIRILLVDDHEVVRYGLRLLLERNPGMRVVGETCSSAMTAAAVERERPDVILLDLDLGEENGLDLIPWLRERAPEARILVLTGTRDVALHCEAVRLGAVGLVPKEHPATVLVQAIDHVLGGRVWLDPGLITGFMTELSRAKDPEEESPEVGKIGALTEREREVIALICEGLQNKVIAQRLSISDTTVRHHLTSIFGKLEVESRLELVIYAFRNRLAHIAGGA